MVTVRWTDGSRESHHSISCAVFSLDMRKDNSGTAWVIVDRLCRVMFSAFIVRDGCRLLFRQQLWSEASPGGIARSELMNLHNSILQVTLLLFTVQDFLRRINVNVIVLHVCTSFNVPILVLFRRFSCT
jgi:hypothetical protein